MADSDLYNFEFLSLVAKITQEIDNHSGRSDRAAAEFVIDLHGQSNKSLDTFKAKLTEAHAAFSDSFIENVDRLILSMHPKYKKANRSEKAKLKMDDSELSEFERKKRLFPGLAMKDKEVPPALPDDVFLKELGDLVSGNKRPRRTDDDKLSPKRQKRDRSRSPRRRSASPRGRDGYGYRSRGGRQPLDEKPVLYKIYNGKVTGIKEFGAFVTLEGVIGRVEGRFFYQKF